MSDQPIGSNTQGANPQNVGAGYPVQDTSASISAPAAMPFLNDTMSISQIGTNQSNNMADPNNPRLKQPTYADIVMQFQLGMAQITTNMLTEWNKSLQKESDRIEAELKTPKYQAWIEQNSSKYIAEQDIKAGKDLTKPVKNSYEQEAAITTGSLAEKDRYAALADRAAIVAGLSSLLSLSVSNIENTTLSVNASDVSISSRASGVNMTTALAIGAGFISNFIQVPDVTSTSQIEIKPIRDAWNQINASNDLITQVGGWFSAMWGIGLVYQLTAQNIPELAGGNEKQPHKDLEFAKGYAQTLINSLEGNGFNAAIMALLTPVIEKSPETKGQQNPELLAVKGKIVLLALALALIYKLEVKSRNPEAQIDEATFAAMLKGGVDFNRNDTFETAELKRQLVAYFQYNLNQLPESEKIKVIEGILAYVSQSETDSDGGVEALMDQQASLEGVFAGNTFQQSFIDKKPI